MDFGLTAEQKLLQETLRDFARRELRTALRCRATRTQICRRRW